MQEQNFEKQVQHKLEELSLTPSTPVWQKVEKEIREKKKRRRAIVLWLFPLLLGAGMFWGIQTLTNKRDQPIAKADTPNTTIENDQSSISSLKQPAVKDVKQPATTISAEEEVTTETNRSSSSNETVQNSAPASVTTNTTTTTADKSTLTAKGKTAFTKRPKNQNDKSSIVAKAEKKFHQVQPLNQKTLLTVVPDGISSSVNESVQDAITTDRITEITASQTNNSLTKAQPLQLLITKTEELKPTINLDSIQNKKGQEKVRKWSWATQATYGIASLQTDFLSKAYGTPMAMSDPQSNAGFPSTTPPPAALLSPSRTENGAALHVGIILKRNINKRFAATAGLQYSYLTIKNSVGQTVERDTIVVYNAFTNRTLNEFYRPAQNGSQLQEYVNKYHFLELPLGIEWKVNRRLPLHIQTGLSLSYLFKTNALVYDPNARIYYQNNDLFSKMQLQFFSGITYQVWQRKNLGIHVGPYLQFGLTSLEKEDKDHHLLSTGLKTTISF